MRTTLNIDDALLDRVMQYTGSKNRSDAVRQALKFYIRQQELQEILAMRGTMEFEDDLEELRALDTMPL